MKQESTRETPASVEDKGFGKGIPRLFRDGVRWRLRVLVDKVHDARLESKALFRELAGLKESEAKLVKDSQSYWSDPTNRTYEQNSHWRGVGIFADDSRWLALGREHLQLYEQFARLMNVRAPLKRIVEWGCGGGVNAVHFGRLADEFYGVDISAASLGECERQMKSTGLGNFVPIMIDAQNPEAAIAGIEGTCDLLISTYVFELLPTPEYGLRVLKIARELLAPGGLAMVQIKYSEGDWKTRSQRWGYVRNLAWNATYRIEEFWQAADKCGLAPQAVKLLPTQPLVHDRNYAYFLLQKSPGAKVLGPDEN
jgi:SAM-dependent methyltransferase